MAAVVAPEHLIMPTPATTNQLQRAHSDGYLDKVENGRFSHSKIRQIGLPWSPELIVRCKHSVGATIAACRVALQGGIVATLGGGTHHASRDEGEGFCIYNDTAIAARTMQGEGRVQRCIKATVPPKSPVATIPSLHSRFTGRKTSPSTEHPVT